MKNRKSFGLLVWCSHLILLAGMVWLAPPAPAQIPASPPADQDLVELTRGRLWAGYSRGVSNNDNSYTRFQYGLDWPGYNPSAMGSISRFTRFNTHCHWMGILFGGLKSDIQPSAVTDSDVQGLKFERIESV